MIHWYQWDAKVSYYHFVIINFSFYTGQYLLYIFRHSWVGCTYANKYLLPILRLFCII